MVFFVHFEAITTVLTHSYFIKNRDQDTFLCVPQTKVGQSYMSRTTQVNTNKILMILFGELFL